MVILTFSLTHVKCVGSDLDTGTHILQEVKDGL